MSTLVESYLIKQVTEDINEYLEEQNATSTVLKGKAFLEWVLLQVFQLREDEVEDTLSVGGKSDNGIDAIFEENNELYIIQGKYGTSNNVDSIHRFINDCVRLLEYAPDTTRDEVITAAHLIREYYRQEKKINCFYVTNEQLIDWEKNQVNIALGEKKFPNVSFHIYDVEKMVERIQLNRGELPKEFKEKTFKIRYQKACILDETFVGVVSLKEFSDFIRQDKESDFIFYSNIRNYLNSTTINKGIKETIENEPKNFWFYNNGITVVCDSWVDHKQELKVKVPQIVNGCQTAKSIYSAYKKVSNQSAEEILNDGYILVRFIKMKSSMGDSEKKEFRDNVTRYTNSQNAVKGLDFYALDQFQRDLKYRLENLSYYYEIQRGAYATEKNRKGKKRQFVGNEEYNYLLNDFNSQKKFVLPAKEVIQAFTAGIKLMPNVAYGRANELTPMGKRWEDIMNEETKGLSTEVFLFPYLIWMYAKNSLGFNRKADEHESYKKHGAFLLVASYFQVLVKVNNKLSNKEVSEPDKVDIRYIKNVFKNEKLNKYLLKISNDAIKTFFRDSKVEEAIGDNMRGFIQNKASSQSEYWHILNKLIGFQLEDNIMTSDYWKELQAIFESEES